MKWMFPERESTCIPRGHWCCLSLWQSDVPCNWSMDVETTGQLWQPAWFVGTFPHLHSVSPIPVAVSLPVMLQNADIHACPSATNEMRLGYSHRTLRVSGCKSKSRGNSRWNFEFMWGERKGEAETSRSSYHSYSIAAASKFVSPHCDWVCLTDTSVSLMAYNSEQLRSIHAVVFRWPFRRYFSRCFILMWLRVSSPLPSNFLSNRCFSVVFMWSFSTTAFSYPRAHTCQLQQPSLHTFLKSCTICQTPGGPGYCGSSQVGDWIRSQ